MKPFVILGRSLLFVVGSTLPMFAQTNASDEPRADEPLVLDAFTVTSEQDRGRAAVGPCPNSSGLISASAINGRREKSAIA